MDLHLDTRTWGDPDIVRFLLGDVSRSSLLAHYDGTTVFAVDPTAALPSSPLHHDHLGHGSVVEPALTQVSPATVRDAVSCFLSTNRLPESLTWQEAAQDQRPA